MKISLLLSTTILALFPLAHTPQATLVIVVRWAFASEGFRPASLTVVNSLATPEQRVAGQTLNRLAANVGIAIGPALGGLFVLAYGLLSDQMGETSFSYVALFLADGVTSFMAYLVLVL